MDNLKIEAEKEAQVILNYFKAKDYISAEVKAKKLIKKFPNFQAVYNLLGLCLQSQKKFLEAIKGKNDLIVKPEQAVNVTKIAEAALLSSKKGTPIYLDIR